MAISLLLVAGSFYVMKRFTETKKWDDPWFWRLSPTAKLLWLYMLDSCDNAGVIDLDLEMAATKLRVPVEPQHLKELESRLNCLEGGKTLIPKFVHFQFGELCGNSKIHLSIKRLLDSYNLIQEFRNGMPIPLVSPKEKEKEQEKEGECEGKPKEKRIPTVEEWIEYARAKDPLWPTGDIRQGWTYYEARGWKDIQKWRMCVSTCHANWKKNNRIP